MPPTLEGLLGTRKGCLAAARMVWKTGLLSQFSASNLENVGEEEDEGDEGDEGEEDADEGVEEGPEEVPRLDPARASQSQPDQARSGQTRPDPV